MNQREHLEEGFYHVTHHDGSSFLAYHVDGVWAVACYGMLLRNYDVHWVVGGPFNEDQARVMSDAITAARVATNMARN